MTRIPEHGSATLKRRALLRACAVLAMLASGSSGAQPVSPAEVLLFETDHLARTKAPAALAYTFRKVSNVEAGFSDTVELALSRKDGRLHARLAFLSGERKHEVPDVADVKGNPVLLGFLERDIAEMKRLTGGQAAYFRKRIRLALAGGAKLTRKDITFQGKKLAAQVVRIQPYLDDPMHARFEHYLRKTYTFVLSDAVPGGVYQLSTTLANSNAARPIVASASSARPPGAGGAGVAKPGGAAPAVAQAGGATPAAAKPGAPQPGAQAGDVPVIEETLTLDKVADLKP